ncbi:fimbrial biogenesis chaperone [Klebsiella michiganensis]|uniref:fimbrial biogenesis chaperone n=1 Tax=Klebsiella michiganensis TaxID=1134687 RepID=UPI0011E6F20F|nr:molecular chaperone [Klebsiella michiganensis]MBZ7507744.1 molecular chaperone [Klebsiella michiganensis]TXV06781.1 molecular chaperone [Klebsiella michiganensis]HBM2906904.1 molecular chaperone [Klebsiella michiganensis]HDS8142570.1 molecular chaperone [Klebsiella michiganensis]HDT1976680.1 molecular chaperone [Klebsiella michiganensis]
MNIKRNTRAVLSAILLAGAVAPAESAVRPQLTRIVAYAEDRETPAEIINESKDTYMVQSWLEDTEGKDKDIPIVLTPPVMKLEGKKSGKLRLVVMKGNIPQDRESVYWLNLQEIPPKAKDADNSLVIAIRSRLKVFVRPAGFDAQGSVEAPSKLTWKIETADGKRWLWATNPTKYYVSFGELALAVQGKKGQRLEDKYRMVPPVGSERYEIPATIKGSSISVTWSGMNDWGGAGKEQTVEVRQ